MAMGSRQMVEKRQRHRSNGAPAAKGKLSSSSSSSIPASSRATLPRGSSSASSSSSASAPANGGNVDSVLFRNLVDMVPLVESLMDRKGNASFKRRASVVYTPTPSNAAKVIDQKGRKMAQTSSVKNQSDHGDNVHPDKRDSGAVFSVFSPRSPTDQDVQNDAEELSALQEQLGNLQKELTEKDEALKSLKETLNETTKVNATVDELKKQIAERDSLVASANSQLASTKVKLSEKEAALEKLEYEVMTSNGKIEELQGDLDSMEFEISSFRRFFEELSRTAYSYPEDYIIPAEPSKHYIDYIDESDILEMERARAAYITAIDAAKESPSEESLAAAAEARLYLCRFLTS